MAQYFPPLIDAAIRLILFENWFYDHSSDINILLNYLILSHFSAEIELGMGWVIIKQCVIFRFSSVFCSGCSRDFNDNFRAIITVLRFEVVNSRASFATWVVFLIFSVAAVAPHFLSSVSLLVMVLLFFAILTLILQRLIKNRYSKNVEKDTNKTYSQSKIEKWGDTLNFIIKFMLVMGMIIAFQVFVAGSYSVNNIMNSINSIFNFGLLITQTAQMGFAGSESHTQAVIIRIISAGILISLAGNRIHLRFLY